VKETVLVSSKGMLSWHQEMGWTVPNLGQTTIHVASGASAIRILASTDWPSTVHIFERWKRLPFAANALKAEGGGGRVASQEAGSAASRLGQISV
jgi:hypothetical protein